MESYEEHMSTTPLPMAMVDKKRRPTGTILVTGSSGFIGTNLCRNLRELGFDVIGVDINPPKDEMTISEFHQSDICDIDWSELDLSRVSSVIHLAAKVSVPESIDYPELYHRVNVEATERLFRSAAEQEVQCIIFASSAACYGDSDAPIKKIGEEGELSSPYAINKMEGEKLALQYSNNITSISCFRFFNVYGPGQSPHSAYASVIPLFIHKIINNENLNIHGDGKQTRDFVHVYDICNTIIKRISMKSSPFSITNIGTGEGVSIATLAETILDAANRLKIDSSSEIITGPPREGDVMHSTADIEPLENIIDSSKFIQLHDGISKLIQTTISNTDYSR